MNQRKVVIHFNFFHHPNTTADIFEAVALLNRNLGVLLILFGSSLVIGYYEVG
ncbi:hypothetical protein [Vibrio splendidus]|uniref:hypothetical protein n=1 Tax=Vibrio splendidus TaxID=29497 RepID=UPI0012FFDA12|nr:hypothetical protein [Vibrio splendidus]